MIRSVAGTTVVALGWFAATLAQAQPEPAPPATAPRVPTVAQARQFVTEMVEQHAAASCQVHSTRTLDLTTDYVIATSIRLDGNRVFVTETTRIHQEDQRKSSLLRGGGTITKNDVDVRTMEFLASDMAPARTIAETRQEAKDCGLTTSLYFTCKNGDCMKTGFRSRSVSDAVRLDGSKMPEVDYNNDDRTSIAAIRFADPAMAARVAIAFDFYREHASSASDLPF